ncbi:NADPH-dependent FMN reductase [Peribacillus glennii]|uniref:NADPH-dependent oxidoreductase n=1 Tax=Peribacillus glennii TaxID=2303991 RepID=A0A372LCY1_9BACI|nr:NAD(P)H-dependent oxidoreductase [Peribacillus glennii]RFU63837.1 NADPH-dependent oxidoreductase [Peribacillus glennii]
MKLVGISGALIGAKTAKIVNEVLNRAKEKNPGLDIELVDLRDYQIEFVDGRPLESYNDDTKNVVEKILEADFFVIGTPVYQASITGALKNLFDHLPTTVFETKVVGFVSTAGSNHHSLVAENQLRPILSFFKALVASKNVFVSNDSFNRENEIINEDVNRRLSELAEELLFLQGKLKG